MSQDKDGKNTTDGIGNWPKEKARKELDKLKRSPDGTSDKSNNKRPRK